MSSPSITFACPACARKLTVPSHLAGVTGPCPVCGTRIQAPSFSSASAPTPLPVTQAPAASEPAPVPPAPRPGATPQTRTHYQPSATPPANPAEAPPLRPEPRQLPHRGNHPEVVARNVPEPIPPHAKRDASKPAPLRRHPYRSNPLKRFLLLALFLAASGGIIYLVLLALEMRPGPKPVADSSTAGPPDTNSTVETPAQVPAPHTKSHTAPPTRIGPVPDLPRGIEPNLPGAQAAEILTQFLEAETLDERLPIIETKTDPDELAASCLAGPLPDTTEMLIAAQESNPIESVIDYYYNVTFDIDDEDSARQVILLRSRGGGEPKVVADPFLDLYGGRLRKYASAPSEKGGVFQVIAYPVPSCMDANIPDREKKYTLKLLPRDETPPIAVAYFSKLSEIGRMLQDDTFSLSHGSATACTVLLRWNTEDNPDYPYLEALDIKTLDWNP